MRGRRSRWPRRRARWAIRRALERAPAAPNADDHEARLELATALFLRGQIETGDGRICWQIVKRDRDWDEDQAARKQLVKFFEALGPKHPADPQGPAQLSAVLFS